MRAAKGLAAVAALWAGVGGVGFLLVERPDWIFPLVGLFLMGVLSVTVYQAVTEE